MSLQAATSRLLFSFARDRMIPGSAYLSKLSPRTHVPVAALIVAGFIPVVIVVIGLFLENAVRTIIVFGSAGPYVAFQMIVLGALIARARGWRPSGPFRLNAWASPMNIGGFCLRYCRHRRYVLAAHSVRILVLELRNDLHLRDRDRLWYSLYGYRVTPSTW